MHDYFVNTLRTGLPAEPYNSCPVATNKWLIAPCHTQANSVNQNAWQHKYMALRALLLITPVGGSLTLSWLSYARTVVDGNALRSRGSTPRAYMRSRAPRGALGRVDSKEQTLPVSNLRKSFHLLTKISKSAFRNGIGVRSTCGVLRGGGWEIAGPQISFKESPNR